MAFTHWTFSRAEEAETNDELEQAGKLYEQAIKVAPANEYPYNRLMIVYRKQKKYKEELALLNQGIKFQEQHENKQKQLAVANKKITQLSNASMKSVGLKDKR